jgi:hypothetical protein
MLVMPQITVNSDADNFVTDEEKATDFYMEIGYTIQNYTTTARVAFPDINAIAQTTDKEGIVFEMGRQYGLTICFTLEAVTFDISVGDWFETNLGNDYSF